MISHKSFLRGGLRTCARSIGGFGWVPGQGPGGDLTWHLQLFVAKKHVDLMMAYPFDREEELVSLLRTILGQGTERLLQARQIMLELQSRAERTIHCLHKLRALVPSEVKWLSVFNKAKRQSASVWWLAAWCKRCRAWQRVGPCVGAKKLPFLLWML